jgi:hypothetical protein
MYRRITLSVCVVAIVGWFQIFTVTSHAASRLTSSALSESMKRLNIYSKE